MIGQSYLNSIANGASYFSTTVLNISNYIVNNPKKILFFYLALFSSIGAEAIKINRVNYATYAMGTSTFANGLQNVHAGLHFELEDGSYRELHYNGKISEYINNPYKNQKKQGFYEIGEIELEYEDAKQMIEAEFSNKGYILGKRDCWYLIEWFTKNKFNKNIKDLDGPIGDSTGVGNTVRDASKFVEKKAMQAKQTVTDAHRELNIFVNNPVKVIHEGIKRPDKVVKNIKSAACKIFGKRC